MRASGARPKLANLDSGCADLQKSNYIMGLNISLNGKSMGEYTAVLHGHFTSDHTQIKDVTPGVYLLLSSPPHTVKSMILGRARQCMAHAWKFDPQNNFCHVDLSPTNQIWLLEILASRLLKLQSALKQSVECDSGQSHYSASCPDMFGNRLGFKLNCTIG